MKAAPPDGFLNSDKLSLTPDTVRKGVNNRCDTRFAGLLAERFNTLEAKSKERAERLEGKAGGAPGRTVSA